MADGIKRFSFTGSRFWFIGLFVLCVVGFGQSYFLKLLGQEGDFSYYVHLHVAMMFLWLSLLIVQPILIYKRRNSLHRRIGRVSSILVLTIIVSSVLVIHSQALLQGNAEAKGLTPEEFLIQPVAMAILFLIPYMLAMVNRHKPSIHARYMICTALPSILEPTVARGLFYGFGIQPPLLFIALLTLTSCIFIILIVAERRQETGRHVFPSMLGLYWSMNIIFVAISTGPLGFIWQGFGKWFLSLPLT
uniref:Cytochrome C and Quinol oxidase polypeptide I n=1 Tax=Candidatus Kentrum sp. LPFa TaxID=2126335 RepID=A0A450WRF8_9GAMM|nr:MAG: hypothetical protein BECKLPF1236B_GA0070989_11774 [Candidatus Kentron sp. LPFa]